MLTAYYHKPGFSVVMCLSRQVDSLSIQTMVYLIVYFSKLSEMAYCKTGLAPAGFYRTQYPASYTHKSLGRTRQFTLPASAGMQMCLLCLSLKSKIPKLFPIFTGYL